jgi:hypothetical protein
MKKNTVRIEFLSQGTIGPLFAVTFIQDSVRVGHWPIHEEGLAGLVADWILRVIRPQ